jgi:uncharacterized metal-binding protein
MTATNTPVFTIEIRNTSFFPAMTTILRSRYLVGGSNRKHHLAMSTAISMGLAAMAVHNPVVHVLGHRLQMPADWLWLVSAGACYAQEWWAGSDRDEEEDRLAKNSAGHYYWLPYGLKVKHRNWASHGLVIGTVIRCIYGWWPLMLALWGLWLTFPVLVGWLAMALGLGALANDLGHLLLDL